MKSRKKKIRIKLIKRITKRTVKTTNYLLSVRYRLARRIGAHYSRIVSYFFKLRYRVMRRVRFRVLRLAVFFMWRLWLRRVEGLEKIPNQGPAILVSNHSSYFDFFVLASVLKKMTVFVAVKDLNRRKFVGWFMKLDIIVYVDRERPSQSFYKQLLWHLKNQKRIVALYPEGTRSRSGKMQRPKNGFVKLAIQANAPVIPVAMRGNYEILPPHKKFPAFKKCEIIVGDQMNIEPSNPMFSKIFEEDRVKSNINKLSNDGYDKIALKIMDQVREMAGVAWEDHALYELESIKKK